LRKKIPALNVSVKKGLIDFLDDFEKQARIMVGQESNSRLRKERCDGID